MATPSFPESLVGALRCVGDSEGLAWDASERDSLLCGSGAHRYEVEGRIVRVGLDDLHPESMREQSIRDQEASNHGVPSGDTPFDLMEIGATMEALALKPEHCLLELGSGRGRFTKVVASVCKRVLGVDISLGSLRLASDEVGDREVGFIHGDATVPHVADGSFDRVLGTLTSNLPDKPLRQASYHAAARALSPGGRFVFTTHFFGLRARSQGESRDGRYSEEGIYRRLLEPSEVRDEISPYFGKVSVRPIQVVVPLSMRLGLPLVPLDRLARRIPGLRNFGHLLLVDAREPRVDHDR